MTTRHGSRRLPVDAHSSSQERNSPRKRGGWGYRGSLILLIVVTGLLFNQASIFAAVPVLKKGLYYEGQQQQACSGGATNNSITPDIVPLDVVLPQQEEKQPSSLQDPSSIRAVRSHWPPSRERRTNKRKGHGEHEIIIVSIISGLFRESMMPPGAVLDVGAQFGEQAAHMAYLAPERTVYAMDPSPKLCEQITQSFAYLSFDNLKVIRGGLAQKDGRVNGSAAGFLVSGMDQDVEFDVYSLDSFFQNETLGFAHIDIEGLELEALKGATKKVLVKDRPIFTTEIMGVHTDPEYTRNLLNFLSSHAYDSYMVDEVCGNRMDFRNLINIPRELLIDLQFSDTFNLAIATNAMTHVRADRTGDGGYFDILELVYPCCRQGGECCPDDKVTKCCDEKVVNKWMRKNNVTKPDAMRSFRSSYVSTMKVWWRLKQRSTRSKIIEKQL